MLEIRQHGRSQATSISILHGVRTRVDEGVSRGWGLARKLLNIFFLLDCFYTTYLNKAFRLNRAKRFFELPLDSITGISVWEAVPRGTLPRWPGVKNSTPKISALFQKAAAEEAKRLGIVRVHLDALWWSAGRDV